MSSSLSSKLMILLLLLLFQETSHAAAINHACPPSSCGSIHDISPPFRLYNDPEDCGDPRYNLYCENNLTVLYLDSSKYYVKAIDYTNHTIRVVDPNIQEYNCFSLPRYSLAHYNFSDSDPYRPYQIRSHSSGDWLPILYSTIHELSKPVTYLSTENSINSSMYMEIARCMNDSYSTSPSWPSQYQKRRLYVSIGGNYLRDLTMVEYRVEMIYMASWPTSLKGHRSISCLDVRNGLEYGIELSWLEGFCKYTGRSRFLRLVDSNDPCAHTLPGVDYSYYVTHGFMRKVLRGEEISCSSWPYWER